MSFIKYHILHRVEDIIHVFVEHIRYCALLFYINDEKKKGRNARLEKFSPDRGSLPSPSPSTPHPPSKLDSA